MMKSNLPLVLILLVAILLRFIYFPQNVYFGYDQARDAFAVQEILDGNLKIMGPQTSFPYFHHGVLYYYIFAPIYFLFDGNPEAVSFFLRIVNAFGAILVFVIAKILFNKYVGLLAALLFAFSYEQTQFALFLNHPSLAVISLLIFYLGWALLIFRQKQWGFFIALLGLGLSIQFEFVELQLVFIFMIMLVSFRKYLPKFNFQIVALSVLSLFVPLSTFIVAEVKNNFISAKNLGLLVTNSDPSQGTLISSSPTDYILIAHRFITDNIIFQPILASVIGALIVFFIVSTWRTGKSRAQLTFLLIWFFGGFIIYLFTKNDAYFYNTGTSISLLMLLAFLLSKLWEKRKLLACILLGVIICSNMYLIITRNYWGPNSKINPQKGLVLSDEKRVIDFIYQKAGGKSFAVNALTMPLNINTTWSYLFEWYGQRKYGYLPVWGGDAALGYSGNLSVVKIRSSLPPHRFLIFEPRDGIYPYLVDQFLAEENNFSRLIERQQFGNLEVWVQEAI